MMVYACQQPMPEKPILQPVVISEPLPSWRATPARQRILDFVAAVTDTAGEAYVPPAQRIATFDHDGTLLTEQPVYFQFRFVFARLRAMAPQHPRWKRDRLIQAAIDNDVEKVFSYGGQGISKLITIAHSGVTTEEFARSARNWMRTARHPTTGRPYSEMVYQPMLELIAYLQAHQFKIFMVTGGTTDLIRPWVEEVYGIPKEHVIGSRYKLSYRLTDSGKAELWVEPAMEFFNNEENKAIAIHQFIGQRPILAVGNSDGDIQMLEYATSGTGERLGVLIHHTDGQREWAYDRQSNIGRLDKGLDKARQNNWLVVDMQKDWQVVYPFEKQAEELAGQDTLVH